MLAKEADQLQIGDPVFVHDGCGGYRAVTVTRKEKHKNRYDWWIFYTGLWRGREKSGRNKHSSVYLERRLTTV